jgi:hypothetical protein
MRESTVENYLVREVSKLGGKAFKWSSPGNKGVPDRLCFFPTAKLYFVEVKAPGKRPTPLQFKVISTLRDMGFMVMVLDTKEMVDTFIEMVRGDMQHVIHPK